MNTLHGVYLNKEKCLLLAETLERYIRDRELQDEILVENWIAFLKSNSNNLAA